VIRSGDKQALRAKGEDREQRMVRKYGTQQQSKGGKGDEMKCGG
jgi:hypothetical protein